MSNLDVIRAWKDEKYRLSLSDEQRAMLPPNPAGVIDLSDAELEHVAGAATELLLTLGCCNGLTLDTCLCTVICTVVCWTAQLSPCVTAFPCGGGGPPEGPYNEETCPDPHP